MTDQPNASTGYTADDNAPIEVTRYEERPHAWTVSTPRTRLRIRKVIVTEERTIIVTVRHEELQIVEEAITANAPLTPREAPGDLEIVLHEEQVYVTTRVVPMERAHVVKRPVAVQAPVTDTVRREQIQIKTDGDGEISQQR